MCRFGQGLPAPRRGALLWNNPKLHTPDRRKVWLACDEHRTIAGDFLGARQFLERRRRARSEEELPETRSSR